MCYKNFSKNHDKNESNTKTVNIVYDQEKISLEDSVQKMPERLNEDVSQRESDSGLVTEIVRDLLQGFLVDDFQRELLIPNLLIESILILHLSQKSLPVYFI